MADYEVLAPGGHARLVSDVKSYADRAGGKGTTQLADGSVTRDKLADGVTDRIDAMRDRCDPLVGNHFFGELAEGTVLTADDTYAAPPESVSVYGVSTQAGTPTPDAPVPIQSVDDLTLEIHGKNVFDDTNSAYYPKSGTVTDFYFAEFTGSLQPRTHIKAGQTYTLSMDVTSTIQPFSVSVGIGRGSYVFDVGASNGQSSGRVSVTFSVTEEQIKQRGDILALRAPRYNTPQTFDYTISNIQLEYGSTATAYAPYVGQSVEIPLSDHIARSLPDGTRDTLTLSYIGPSAEHEGWGVFGVSLLKKCDKVADMGALNWSFFDQNSYPHTFRAAVSGKAYVNDNIMCAEYSIGSGARTLAHGQMIGTSNANLIYLRNDDCSTTDAIEAALDGVSLDYGLATPQTTDLGTVELPILPNQLTAWADGGSAQPTIAMEYERALSIVIPRIEAAISDLATS